MNEDTLTIETRIALWSALADLWLDTQLQDYKITRLQDYKITTMHILLG